MQTETMQPKLAVKVYSDRNVELVKQRIRNCKFFIACLQADSIEKKLTSNRAVGRPGRNRSSPLIKQYISCLLTHSIISNWGHLTVIKAVPLTIDRVLAISCENKPRIKLFNLNIEQAFHRI